MLVDAGSLVAVAAVVELSEVVNTDVDVFEVDGEAVVASEDADPSYAKEVNDVF